MKKMNVFLCGVFCLFLISCSDEKTTTVTPVEPVTAAPPATPPPTRTTIKTTQPVVVKEQVEVIVKEPAKTEISIGQSGGSVKTKKGTDVSVGETGVKVGTKDVKIDIKRDRK